MAEQAIYLGGVASTGGGFIANTLGIFTSSMVNFVGWSLLTNGKVQPDISFGFASVGPTGFRSNFD